MKSKDEAKQVRFLFEKLMRQTPSYFPVPGKSLKVPKVKGVYVITDEKEEVLHVGQTPRGKAGLHQRLKNHLYGLSSFTDVYLKGDGGKLRGKCCYRYLVIEKSRTRVLLEAYAIGRLCPKHVGEG